MHPIENQLINLLRLCTEPYSWTESGYEQCLFKLASVRWTEEIRRAWCGENEAELRSDLERCGDLESLVWWLGSWDEAGVKLRNWRYRQKTGRPTGKSKEQYLSQNSWTHNWLSKQSLRSDKVLREEPGICSWAGWWWWLAAGGLTLQHLIPVL